jgi:hypothetical protein
MAAMSTMLRTIERRADPRHPMRFEKTTNMRVTPQPDPLPPGDARRTFKGLAL